MFTSLGMLSALLAVGLCIDISHFYMVKTELQHAADAGALAGASALNSSATGIRNAVSLATVTMNKVEFGRANATIAAGSVTFAVNLEDNDYMSQASAEASPASIRFVRVTTDPAPVKVHFARMLLGASVNLTATAVAGQSVPLNVLCGFIPVSVIDYGNPIVPGQLYTFRSASGGKNSISPGNYQILAVAGRGGRDVRIGLAAGVDMCARQGEWYEVDTKPGQTSGPVRQGINTRFDSYQGGQVNPTDHPPDTNIKEGITYAQYRDGTSTQAPSHPGVAGRRIVIIPIINQNEYDQGRDQVRFNRFGLFFLRSKVPNGNGGDLQAEYISDRITVSQGDYDPNGGPSNALIAVPVLYK
ncbi:MAG: pilus assembly protein TadG-related protein [Blastocatellia bacterium]|nr:pilus assembly protein TadG-related protein [Blastocatellia bacterium]